MLGFFGYICYLVFRGNLLKLFSWEFWRIALTLSFLYRYILLFSWSQTQNLTPVPSLPEPGLKIIVHPCFWLIDLLMNCCISCPGEKRN